MAEKEPPEKPIFLAAVEIEAAADRAAYLDRACAGDPDLRAAVDALLRSHATPPAFLDSHAAPPVGPTVPPADRVGTAVGPYTLTRQIGEGGMGTVYVAEQTHPVRRTVAVKVIKPGMDSRQVIARFEAERQALAVMDHANIARVLDAGTTESGLPYFVMELVRGTPITTYCDENRLTPRQRLELFVPVCQAVQHAHQKGVIHRDIKPSNVLVAVYDGHPVPKVIDFGVAKATGQPPAERAPFTQHGTVVGTLEYMSPEQAETSASGVDTRTDIYSLGVLLYELLTGSTPLTERRLKEAAFGEILRIVKEEEPPRPSARLSGAGEALASISARRNTEPAKLARLVRGDLDWIVMKCLEKDRGRRYETANGFAADVLRYLADEPVLACPPSAAYRLRKFVRRNRAPVLAAAAFALLLAGGAVGTAWQAVRATRAEHLAKDNEARALAQKEKAQANFRLAKDAVDKYLNAVTDNPKLKEKDFFQLRKDLLETAVPFYRKFAEEQNGDPESEAARGRAYHRLAVVRDTMGEKAAALSDCEAMRTIFARLVAEFPDAPAYRSDLATSHDLRGNLLVALGKLADAEFAFRKALTIEEQLADAFPGVPEYRWDLARTHNNLGRLLYDLGRSEDAVDSFRKAVRIQEQLIPRFPGEPGRRGQLASSHNNLGILLKLLGSYAEAETASIAAQRLYAQLVVEYPNVPAYRNYLAASYGNLALLRDAQGKPAEAAAAYRAAQSILEKLVADFPSVPRYRQDLARGHNNLGMVLNGFGQRAEAEAAHRAGLRIQENLVADFPGVVGYGLELGNSYIGLGVAITDKGQALESLDWFAKAIGILESVAKGEPRLATAKELLVSAHWSRGNALDALQRYDDAVRDWDRAIELVEPSQKTKFENRKRQSLSLAAQRRNSGK